MTTLSVIFWGVAFAGIGTLQHPQVRFGGGTVAGFWFGIAIGVLTQ